MDRMLAAYVAEFGQVPSGIMRTMAEVQHTMRVRPRDGSIGGADPARPPAAHAGCAATPRPPPQPRRVWAVGLRSSLAPACLRRRRRRRRCELTKYVGYVSPRDDEFIHRLLEGVTDGAPIDASTHGTTAARRRPRHPVGSGVAAGVAARFGGGGEANDTRRSPRRSPRAMPPLSPTVTGQPPLTPQSQPPPHAAAGPSTEELGGGLPVKAATPLPESPLAPKGLSSRASSSSPPRLAAGRSRPQYTKVDVYYAFVVCVQLLCSLRTGCYLGIPMQLCMHCRCGHERACDGCCFILSGVGVCPRLQAETVTQYTRTTRGL